MTRPAIFGLVLSALAAPVLVACAGSGAESTLQANAAAEKPKAEPSKPPARRVKIAASTATPEPIDAPTPAQSAARGDISTTPGALDAAEARALLSGNSTYVGGTTQRFAVLHAPGGALKGKSWTGGETDTGAGSWKIEADGRYCRKWNNGWANGEWGCFRLYRQGDAVMMERVSGSGANGKVTLVSGNAYGL